MRLPWITALLLIAAGAVRPVMAACPDLPPGPVIVPVDGQLSDIKIDAACDFIYATNYTKARVEIFSLRSMSWQASVAAGVLPVALDLSPDGKSLYVANSGSLDALQTYTVSHIDLQQPHLVRNYAMPAGYERRRPFDVAVAANGTVFISAWNGALYPGTMMKIDAGADRLVVLWEGATSLFASADRKVIGIATEHDYAGDWSYRYLSDGDIFTRVTRKPGYIGPLNGDGTIALYGTSTVVANQVVDMRSPAFASRGVIPTPSGTVMETVLNAAGTIAYRYRAGAATKDPAFIDIVDLMRLKQVGTLPVGAPTGILASASGMALSPDGAILAAITTVGISLVRAEGAPPPSTQVTVLSAANDPVHSLLRFYNTGATAGSATVTLADPATGARLAVWQSPPIAPGAAPQFDVRDMEAAATAPFTKPPRYVATITATFAGSFAHVTWSPGGALANLGGCEDRFGPGRSVANVHSTRLGADYPSELAVVNEGSAAAPLTLGLFDARTGARIGTYNGADLAPGTGRTLLASDIEVALKFTPPEDLPHYIVKLEGALEGKLRHQVYHQPTGVLSDMSMVCALPPL